MWSYAAVVCGPMDLVDSGCFWTDDAAADLSYSGVALLVVGTFEWSVGSVDASMCLIMVLVTAAVVAVYVEASVTCLPYRGLGPTVWVRAWPASVGWGADLDSSGCLEVGTPL